ncbi:hypothetical protein GCM10022204_11290 [Microlunatus aurantiacus]|uniref:Uncharacterized protein n=1 Tax=Microlunatus aurantiacus TaxID=446786 RepID=A0ABP7D0H5_9ACTN
MSSASYADGLESWWECALPGEVIDALTDGVASPDDALARAQVVAGIVLEIVETVQWRCADRAGDTEIESLRRLLAEAQAHRDRMQTAHDLQGASRSLAAAQTEEMTG